MMNGFVGWILENASPAIILGLALWVIWWLLLVDWKSVGDALKQGAWVGLVLLGIAAVLVWTNMAPADEQLLFAPLPGYVEKLTIVFGLYVIMLGCGALQLALWPAQED